MGVGVGEASLGPATTSILADFFDQRRLPLAYGIVSTAPFVGTGLASMIGGPLVDYLEAQPDLSLPILGDMFSWQVVLILVGLPGILLAASMFTIPEPARRGKRQTAPAEYTMREVLDFVYSRGRYLRFHFIAYLCLSIQGFAFLTWIIEFFVRKHDWSRTEIGLSYGMISLVAGIIGSVWAGFYAGRMLASGNPDATMRLCFRGTLVLGPLAVIMPLLSDATLALWMCIPITFCMAMPPGLSSTALQAIAPNRMRGQLVAIYMICVSFISYLFAPLIIGLMNNYVFGRETAIDLSLSSLAIINYTIAAVCLALSLEPLREALLRTKEFDTPEADIS
jgi:MFS family permease